VEKTYKKPKKTKKIALFCDVVSAILFRPSASISKTFDKIQTTSGFLAAINLPAKQDRAYVEEP